jgi:uncharacterized FlaG/YvyC family protein
MEIAPVHRAAPTLDAVASAVTPDKQAENREVIQAVKALNGTEMFGPENELLFQMDRHTRRVIVRIVNRSTGDVVSQVPAEYVLRLAEDLGFDKR